MKFASIVIISVLLATACAKHAGDTLAPTTTATLIITAPTPNQTLSAADSIRITAVATAPATMHGYDLYLTKPNDTAKLQLLSVHDHNDTLLIDRRLTPDSTGAYEAHILLRLDHVGNALHKSVTFKTN